MADNAKSPRTKGKNDKETTGAVDEGWKNIKHSDDKAAVLPRGKGHYKINEVDLTEHLPVPLHFGFGETEKKAFAEFRKQSKKCTDSTTDYYISRFLVARKWDMKKSVELFDGAMKWREDNHIDEILDTFPDNYWYKMLMEYWPNSAHPEKVHTTKDGCPIIYERIGLVHPKMCDLIPRETLFKHHVYSIELTEKANHKVAAANQFSPGNILIEDLAALTSSHLYNKVTGLIQEISSSDEQHYPESLRKIYIVNPPSIFSLVWGIMKPFIEERTLQKFSFGEPKDFKAEWEATIGLDNLPKYLGGNLDWEPSKGGSVAAYLPADLVKKEIPRKEEIFVEVAVKKGQIFHWQVMCKKDINLALFVKTGASVKDRKAVPEWPNKKYNDDLSPHHGWQTAAEDCTFILHIDNTDSWMMARKVKYFTYIKDPLVPKEGSEKKEKKESSSKKDKKK